MNHRKKQGPIKAPNQAQKSNAIDPKSNAIHSVQYLPSFCLRPLWGIPTWDGWTIWQAVKKNRVPVYHDSHISLPLVASSKKIEFQYIPIIQPNVNHFEPLKFSCPTFWDVKTLGLPPPCFFFKDVPYKKTNKNTVFLWARLSFLLFLSRWSSHTSLFDPEKKHQNQTVEYIKWFVVNYLYTKKIYIYPFTLAVSLS